MTVVYKHGRRKWSLPDVFEFFRGELYFYEVLGFRRPKKNEWFVSGAVPTVYQTAHDLTNEFIVVKPTDRAVRVVTYKREA